MAPCSLKQITRGASRDAAAAAAAEDMELDMELRLQDPMQGLRDKWSSVRLGASTHDAACMMLHVAARGQAPPLSAIAAKASERQLWVRLGVGWHLADGGSKLRGTQGGPAIMCAGLDYLLMDFTCHSCAFAAKKR
eukprot:97059-Pelagomonas_calceolata.AAC.3